MMLELVLLKNVGEFMDRLMAYKATWKQKQLENIELKYPISVNFFQVSAPFLEQEFIDEYEQLFWETVIFLQKSVKKIKNGAYTPIMGR
jgi:hypothetical protein